jgi:hypothetical protein
MSNVPLAQKRLIDALSGVAIGPDSNEELTARLRLALLEFSSQTPDNLNCTERIEIGAVGDETGLKIRNKKLKLGDIAYAVEDMPMPAELAVALPEMTAQDWEVFTRLTTLLYILFDRSSAPQD